MKDKLKQFYTDKKDVVVTVLGGLLAVTGVVALGYAKQSDGRQIVGGGMVPGTDDNEFCVALKNGKHTHFYRPEE